jgi:hypothetical protein
VVYRISTREQIQRDEKGERGREGIRDRSPRSESVSSATLIPLPIERESPAKRSDRRGRSCLRPDLLGNKFVFPFIRKDSRVLEVIDVESDDIVEECLLSLWLERVLLEIF